MDEVVEAWRAKHNAIPINHMVTVTEDMIQNYPEAVQEVYDMYKKGYEIAKAAGELSPAVRIGQDAVWHTLEVCMDYCVAQGLTSRKFTRKRCLPRRLRGWSNRRFGRQSAPHSNKKKSSFQQFIL